MISDGGENFGIREMFLQDVHYSLHAFNIETPAKNDSKFCIFFSIQKTDLTPKSW
jgi:hypothetical protein